MAPNIASLGLRRLLESLPQELYDEIYNLTCTAESKVIDLGMYNCGATEEEYARGIICRRQDNSTRYHGRDSINLFLVDRASSKTFAKSYFGGIILFRGLKTCVLFLDELTDEHRAMLKDLRMVDDFEWDGDLEQLVLHEPGLGEDLLGKIKINLTIKGLGLAGLVKTDEEGFDYHSDVTTCFGCCGGEDEDD